jgi:hypothetical protein
MEHDWWLMFTAGGTECGPEPFCSPLNSARNAATETTTRTSGPGHHLMLVRVLRVDSASSTPWRRSTTAGANTVATD